MQPVKEKGRKVQRAEVRSMKFRNGNVKVKVARMLYRQIRVRDEREKGMV